MNYKRKANITLSLVAIGFIFFLILRHFYRDVFIIRLVFFVIEAALIGGVADWFAVTALFREPLGFSFHTAIVPKNRKIIIESIVSIVEKELLSVETLKLRLDKINIIGLIINWVDNGSGKKYIIDKFSDIVKEYMEGLSSEKLSGHLKRIISDNIQELNIRSYMQDFMRWNVEHKSYKSIMSPVIDGIIAAAEKPETRGKIYEVLNEIKEEKTHGLMGRFINKTLEAANVLNMSELTDSVQMHLIESLYDMKNEEKPLNSKVCEILEEHFTKTITEYFTEEQVKIVRNGIIECMPFDELTRVIIETSVAELNKVENIQERENTYSPVLASDGREIQYMEHIREQLDISWESFKENAELLKAMEGIIKNQIFELIKNEHSFIGSVVYETLNSFTDEDLNNFIETRAGNDLQWIRINGSIVGGMIGFFIFLFLNFIYSPLIKDLFK